MKTKILILATMAIISSCCKNEVKVPYKVVEKFHTQDRDGVYISYYLLLENGLKQHIYSNEYVKVKIGDEYFVRECND